MMAEDKVRSPFSRPNRNKLLSWLKLQRTMAGSMVIAVRLFTKQVTIIIYLCRDYTFE